MGALKVSDLSPYLETEALGGKEATVTIESVRQPTAKDVGPNGRIGRNRMILKYKGSEKEHVIGRTVQKQIRQLYGNDTAAWIGQKITLMPDTHSDFGKKNEPCIRVKV